jgi:hypothetical protein
MILPVVLYGCEALFVTVRGEHRLKVFENRVLRRIFGPKSDEVMGGWRKLHNEELRDLYSSSSIIRITKSSRGRNVYRLLVGKPEKRIPLRRLKCRWVDNIRMDLGEIEWSVVGWIGLAQDRNKLRALVNSALNLRVP